MDTENKLFNLAKSLLERTDKEIIQSWQEDAAKAAQRIKTGMYLRNCGDYGTGDKVELSFQKKAISVIARS